MKLKLSAILPLLLTVFPACDRGEMGYSFTDNSISGEVVVFYAAAANNISYLIRDNISTIEAGSLPQSGSQKTVLVFSHMESNKASYLRKIQRDEFGELKSDTLFTIAAGKSALEADVMRSVLTEVGELYPDSNYTLILSSHGSGWLPQGYYMNPEVNKDLFAIERRSDSSPSYEYPSFGPVTKTFGMEKTISGTLLEMEITDLAGAIPIHLSCIVLDACLMGGIETAYELRNVCDKICFSPAEVPGKGYDYNVLTRDLLSDSGTPEAFSRAYYERWVDDPDYGVTSVTVLCSGLDNLAAVCRPLFEKYRSAIQDLQKYQVQGYYRFERHYFFDLEDILVKAGIGASEKAALEKALDGCISYKAASDSFMKNYDGFSITNFCGVSMYMPSATLRTAYLDAFYKGLAWNKATGLVK